MQESCHTENLTSSELASTSLRSGDIARRTDDGNVVLILSEQGRYGGFEMILHGDVTKWVPRKNLKRLDM